MGLCPPLRPAKGRPRETWAAQGICIGRRARRRQGHPCGASPCCPPDPPAARCRALTAKPSARCPVDPKLATCGRWRSDSEKGPSLSGSFSESIPALRHDDSTRFLSLSTWLQGNGLTKDLTEPPTRTSANIVMTIKLVHKGHGPDC